MSLARTLVRISYRLDNRPAYQGLKRRVRALMAGQARHQGYFDIFFSLILVSSVFLSLYQSVHAPGGFAAMFDRLVVGLLALEFLLRLWVCSDAHKRIIDEYEHAELIGGRIRLLAAARRVIADKWRFLYSPLAVIDLLAMVPSLFAAPWLRVFLIFRLLKLYRYNQSMWPIVAILVDKRLELTTLAAFTGFVIAAASTAIYLLEQNVPKSQIKTLFDAVYWSFVTVATVGYGDIVPQTAGGRIVAIALMVAGIGVIALATSILIAAFAQKLAEIDELIFFRDVDRLRGFVLICGYGRVGEIVAGQLAADGQRVVILEKSPQRVDLARKKGLRAFCGDAACSELIERMQRHASAVLAITADDVTNVFVTLTAHYLNPGIVIIARANDEGTGTKLLRAGADHVIEPHELVGLAAAEYVGQPVAFEALYGILAGREGFGIDAIPVETVVPEQGLALGRFPIERFNLILFGVVAVAVGRSGPDKGYVSPRGRKFYFKPPPDFLLRPQDALVVFGHDLSIRHFKERLSGARMGLPAGKR